METLVIYPKNVCSRKMTIQHENGVVVHAEVEGGCRGNLRGICNLIEGMKIDEIVKRLEGVKCHGLSSCPNELAQGLKQLL